MGKRSKYSPEQRNFKFNQVFGTLLPALGGCLMVIEINIYEHTVIPFIIPFGIWILSGLIIAPFAGNMIISDKLMILEKMRFVFRCIRAIWSVISFGSIACFTFMILNYYGAGKEIEYLTLKIDSVGHLAESRRHCRIPYAFVNISGHNKQLLFPCSTKLDGYNYVEMETRKGLFNFMIMTDFAPILKKENNL